MHYLIDGYNVLFSLESSNDLQLQRKELTEYLTEKFSRLKLSGFIIFDGSHNRDEVSGRSYGTPLEVLFSPKGQTADCTIVEHVEFAKNPKEITVITNDSGLKRRIRSFGAHVKQTAPFIRFLEKKTYLKKEEKYPLEENPREFHRLLKIFERRLED